MKVIDLFAGAGGFSTGAVLAGCKVVWAANHWQLAVNTHQANHPEAFHLCQAEYRQQKAEKIAKYQIDYRKDNAERLRKYNREYMRKKRAGKRPKDIVARRPWHEQEAMKL